MARGIIQDWIPRLVAGWMNRGKAQTANRVQSWKRQVASIPQNVNRGNVARAPQASGGGGLASPGSGAAPAAWSAGGGGGGGWSGGGGGWSGGGGGGGGYDAAAAAKAAQDKVNKEGKDRSDRENANTKAQVEGQLKLIEGFGKARDTKLANILSTYTDSDKRLVSNYGKSLGAIRGTLLDNDKAQADTSFNNIVNAIRERGDITKEVASQGGGETDQVVAALSALRNLNSNQTEANRAFFDTLRSGQSSITGLNTETSTSRNNLFNQAEADREAAWANYGNQAGEAWTQISNIENANTNIDSDSSNAYVKTQADAMKKAAAATKNSYARKRSATNLDAWGGKGTAAQENRAVTSSNRSAAVNLGGPMKRAEGATLRKW